MTEPKRSASPPVYKVDDVLVWRPLRGKGGKRATVVRVYPDGLTVDVVPAGSGGNVVALNDPEGAEWYHLWSTQVLRFINEVGHDQTARPVGGATAEAVRFLWGALRGELPAAVLVEDAPGGQVDTGLAGNEPYSPRAVREALLRLVYWLEGYEAHESETLKSVGGAS